jgi:hypothetical protein
MHQRYLPGFADEGPYLVAFVQLEEGPYMMSMIVDPPEGLACGMPLEVVFERLGDQRKSRRAGESRLAWNLPALAGPETLALHSADFAHEGGIPRLHAGGQNISPVLAWAASTASGYACCLACSASAR